MSSTQFVPQLRSVREVLLTTLMQVPRYQRPYSWTPENLGTFAEDVLDENDEGYFIGPMVVYNDGLRVSVVDGQQRLTTITLFLVAIRHLFDENDEAVLADGVHGFLEKADEDNRLRYIFYSAAGGEYLCSTFLQRRPVEGLQATNEDQRNLDIAYREILRLLETRIQNLPEVERGDGGEIKSATTSLLKSIRQRLLMLRVIWVPLENEDDAYAIFETLNSRGKDLDTVDLLKNLIFRQLQPENADHDSTAATWQELRRTLEEDARGVRPNAYILHWWQSQLPYVGEARLYQRLNAHIKAPGVDATGVLDSLVNDARRYAKISNPKGSTWTRQQKEIADRLSALQIFGVKQPRPFLLATLRAYEEKRLTLSMVKKALKTVEAFHYTTTAVMRLSSSGGVSKMYASYASRLSAARSKSDAADVITELCAALSMKRPPRDEFVASFSERLRYSSSEAGMKDLVFYTLQRMQSAHNKNVPIDETLCNVEHIHAQSTGDDWCASIGNLLWVSERLNQKLGVKTFPMKSAILKAQTSSYFVDDIISKPSWGESEVKARARAMAERAYDQVWQF